MRKLFSMGIIAVLISCNSNSGSDTPTVAVSDSSGSSTAQDVTYAYPISYSSKFTMGDSKNSQTVLNIWKVWENGDLSKFQDYFADSIEMHFWDGSMVNTTKDSAIAAAQKVRNIFTAVSCSVAAVIATKSTDKDENWALVWGTETLTPKNGKADSAFLQETWRFNKDGKANLVYQYAQKPSPPRK